MINSDIVRMFKFPILVFDVGLVSFLAIRITALIDTFWSEIDEELFLGITYSDVAGFIVAMFFFVVMVIAWYCQVEKSQGLAESEDPTLSVFRTIALIAGVTVFLAEGAVALTLFEAEYSNPFRTVEVSLWERTKNGLVALAISLTHACFSYLTMALVIPHLQEKAKLRDEETLNEAGAKEASDRESDDDDDDDDFELHAAE